MPEISVLIPVYNCEKYIKGCLDSVLTQPFKDFEIICVDDGSTDSSLEILKDYAQKDSRIKAFESEKNSGNLAARKKCISHISGDHVIFVDSDDLLESGALEMISNAVNAHDCDIINFNCSVTSLGATENQLIKMENFVNRKSDNVDEGALLLECFVNEKLTWTLWNKVYKASLLKKIYPFITDSPIYFADDMYLFALIYSNAKSFSYCDDVIYNYRLGAGEYGGKMNFGKFEKSCNQKIVSDEVAKYLQQNTDFSKTKQVSDKINTILRNDVFYNFLNDVEEESKERAFALFHEVWGTENLMNAVIELSDDLKSFKAFAENQNKTHEEYINSLKAEVSALNNELKKLNDFHEDCEKNRRREWIWEREQFSNLKTAYLNEKQKSKGGK